MDSEGNFQLVAEKFLQSDASIIELTNSFTDLVAESKQKFDDGGRTAHIDKLLDCIHKYLHCIIEYAEGGNALTRSVTLKQLCNRICTAVDQLKIEHEFVKNLSLLTFESLFGQPSWIAKEILRMYSAIIQQSDKAVRTEVIQEKAPYYLGRLMDELPFGDFEFQLLVVEILFRICTKEVLNNMIGTNFLTEEFREAFNGINTEEFDLTARSFLNLLNEAEKFVFSLLCNKVVFDDYRLQEPPELTSFKGLWVDFNVRAATVTLFINNESFNQVTKWEMITIFPENIAKVDVSYVFNEEKRKKEGLAKFALKGPCQLCYAAAQHKLLTCRSLTLHSLETEKFREAFNQAFPKIHKKAKQKPTTTLTHKRGYKPLDIISVKSGATNPSTTFNVTLDSSVTGKRPKSKNVGGKSVTVADSTMSKTISSKKSLNLSSRKNLNLSLNHSNLSELEEKNDDLSLLSYKIKNLRKTCSSKMKRFVNFDDISSGSNLSVLEHVETGKDAERAVASQKMKLSGSDRLDNDMYNHEKSKERRFSEYNKEFLSNLIDIEDNEDDREKSYKNLEKGGSFGASKSKLLRTEADSTTLIGGLYSSNLLIEDNESDEFQSIVDIDKKSSEQYRTKQKSSGLKKIYADNKLNFKTLKNSKITASSLDQSISGLSADIDSNLGKNKQKIKKTRLRTSKIQREKNTSRKITENCRNMEMGSSLGVLLSPDLFILSNQDSDNNENKIPKTTKKDPTASCIIQNVSVSSLIHSTQDPYSTRSGGKKILSQKYPNNGNSQESSQVSLDKNNSSTKKSDSSRTLKKCKLKLSLKDFKGYRILGDYPASALIDRARDCNLDEFDKLKLERPKNLSQSPKVEVPVEPELIEIPTTKSQNPLSAQTEMFETALTHLDIQETPSLPTTGKDLELFQDISQENACYRGSSEENSQEVNFSSNKSRIQVLSNIQIQPPISKLRKDGSFVSQDKGFTSTEEKDKIKESDETHTYKQPHVIRAPTPDDQSTISKKTLQDSAKNLISNDDEFEVNETQGTSNSGGSSETYLSNENIIISSVEKTESDTKKETEVFEIKALDPLEEKVSKDEIVKNKLPSQEGEKMMRKEVVKEVDSNAEQEVLKKPILKQTKLSDADDDIPLSELKRKIQTKTANSQHRKYVSFDGQCTEQSSNSPYPIGAFTPDKESNNSKEKVQDSTKQQIHNSNNDNFQTTSNSEYSSGTNHNIGVVEKCGSEMKNQTKVLEVEVAPGSPEKKLSQDEIIEKKLLMMVKDTELSNIDSEDNTPLSERLKLQTKTAHPRRRKYVTFVDQKKAFTEEKDGIEKSGEKISSEHSSNSPNIISASTPEQENVQDSTKNQISNLNNDNFRISQTQNCTGSNLENENNIMGVVEKRESDVKNKKKALEMKGAPEPPKKKFPEDVKIKKKLLSQKEGKTMEKSIAKVEKEVESNAGQEVRKKIVLKNTKLSNMMNDHEDDRPLSEIKRELQKKTYSTKTSTNKKGKGEVETPTLRETSSSNQTDKNIKLKTSDSRMENDDEIYQKREKTVLKRSIDKTKENENTEVGIKIPKMVRSNAQVETEIKKSDQVFNEVEKSLSLLFDMENNEAIEKPSNLPTKKILADTNRFANTTANTSNSLIAGNAGMLKRGRKLFSHENEEENFMNFTLVQEKNEVVDPVEEPKRNRKKQDKDSRNSLGKSKNKKSRQQASKNHSEIRYKKESTCINRSRTKRLDAFYDRVIEKLKTGNSSSRTSHPIIPKVRRSENDRDGKYNLDFSLLKASFQKKQETTKSKFSSGQNENGDFVIQESCHKEGDREERNVMCENQQEDTDEILREFLKNLGMFLRKTADGTLKKPSPAIQKILLATTAALIDL